MQSYQFRPNKFVSRRLFVDLLRNLERYGGYEQSVYFGMGALTMEDHRLIRQDLAIKGMVCFDQDAKMVARQRFNKPFKDIKFVCDEATGVISAMDRIIRELELAEDSRRIVWLDFTDPRAFRQQLDDWQALLTGSAHLDVVRITVNARASALGGADLGMKGDELRSYRLEKLKKRVGGFLPEATSTEEIKQSNFPGLMVRVIENATVDTMISRPGIFFVPLQLETYADTHEMVSVSGMLVEEDWHQLAELLDHFGIAEESLFDWTSIDRLSVPNLTLLECLKLEQLLPGCTYEELSSLAIEILGGPEPDAEMLKALSDYAKVARHVPHWHHIAL